MNGNPAFFGQACPLALFVLVCPVAFAQDSIGASGPSAEVNVLTKAEENSAPRISWTIAAEVEDDWTFSANDSAAEINDLSPTVETALSFEFIEEAGLFSTLVLEPVRDPRNDRTFSDVGLYAEELYGQLANGQIKIRAGKFNPAFGQAWDTAPGIFGTSFAEDYELTERVGGGFAWSLPAASGAHELSASLFMADRTVLSNSAFTKRGQLSNDDGGASNTGGLQSFAVSLDGALSGECGSTGSACYTAGFRYQPGGDNDLGDEKGFVLGIRPRKEAGSGELELLAEAAYFIDAEAGDVNAFYGTIGAAYEFHSGDAAEAGLPLTASAVYSLRDFEKNKASHLATTTLEAEITPGFSVGIGYAFSRKESENAHALGILFAYEIGGGMALEIY